MSRSEVTIPREAALEQLFQRLARCVGGEQNVDQEMVAWLENLECHVAEGVTTPGGSEPSARYHYINHIKMLAPALEQNGRQLLTRDPGLVAAMDCNTLLERTGEQAERQEIEHVAYIESVGNLDNSDKAKVTAIDACDANFLSYKGGSLKCPKCKENEVHAESKQIRGSDEPMTVICRCLNDDCGHTWRL